MIKNIKLATLYGVILWVVIFIAVTIVIFIPGIGDNAWVKWIVDWIVVSVATFFLAKKYFQKNSGNVSEGVILGLYWFAVSFVLDIAITIPFFIKRQVEDEFGRQVSFAEAAGYFYIDWRLWIGLLLLVGITVFVSTKTFSGSQDLPNAFPEE